MQLMDVEDHSKQMERTTLQSKASILTRELKENYICHNLIALHADNC